MSNGPTRNDTYRVFLLFVFVLAWFPVADEIMQGAILHQSGEDKDEANRHKEIHCCDVGDLGERLPGNGAEGSHRQDGGDSWGRQDKADPVTTSAHWITVALVRLNVFCDC